MFLSMSALNKFPGDELTQYAPPGYDEKTFTRDNVRRAGLIQANVIKYNGRVVFADIGTVVGRVTRPARGR